MGIRMQRVLSKPKVTQRSIRRAILLALLMLLLFRPGGIPGVARPPGSSVEKQVELFLRDYYKAFEMSEGDRNGALERVASGLTEDYTAIFYIPSQKRELLHFDKKTILEGFAHAFSLYSGKKPVMKIRNVIVLPRNEQEVVAFYQMDFYLEGQLRNDALAIADLQRENGSWRMYRKYENKRR